MKILITGGAGYIGNELLIRLSSNPWINNIVVYDNLSRKNYNLFLDGRLRREKITFINAELPDIHILSTHLKDTNMVYHLAGLPDSSMYGEEDLLLQQQINQWFLVEIVNMLKESSVSKFIYMSTDAVYGYSDNPMTIDSPLQPNSTFAKTKIKGERIVSQLDKYMDTYILRCSGVYGFSPSARFEALINRLMFEVHFMGRIIINENGNQVRTYIHVDQVAGFLNNLSDSRHHLYPGIYNLSGKLLSIFEIVATIREIYPKMEEVWCDKNLKLNHRLVSLDHRLDHMMPLQDKTLKEELNSFREQFIQTTQAVIS